VPRPPEKVFVRLLGALGEAEIVAPRLRAALSEISGRASLAPDPLSRLPGNLQPLARKVTLRGDPAKHLWEMREALFAPPPFRATWKLRLPPGARLGFETAGSAQATVAVEVVRGPAARRILSVPARGAPWAEREADLSVFAGEEVGLRLVTEGRGHVFLGAPRLWGRAPDAPPSVIILAIDTLSAEAVGFSGGGPPTPSLDRLAARGTVLPQAFTNANWTRASTLSMFASEYSTTLGINVHSWWLDRARRAELYRRFEGMLPELMKRAGYATATIGNNLFVLGYHSAGVEMGFERVSDFRNDHRDTPDITEATERFLRDHRERPFFLFLNYNTPHHPYTPPARYLARLPGARGMHPELRRYYGEVAFADDHTGHIVRVLDDLGISDRTLVVLTSDHGEGLRDDVSYINVAIERYSRFTHTVNLYDEVMRVPLAFVRPADIPAGRRVPVQVRLLDLAPTVLSLVGLPPHPQHRGVDLSPLLHGRGEPAEPLPAFTEGKKCSALRWKGYKYIHREPGFDVISRKREGFTPRRVPEELYHVEADPRELKDLVGSKPAMLDELRQAHRMWRQELLAGPRARAPWTPAGARVVEAPAAPRARTHLAAAGDGPARVIAGSLEAEGAIRRYRLLSDARDHALWLARPNRLDFSFDVRAGEGRLYVETHPPGAPVRLVARADGRTLGNGELMRFGVRLWREGALATEEAEAPREEPGQTEKLDHEVESALRGWGYIQQGEKVLK
jgi:arylsulfatase A-like enzyme